MTYEDLKSELAQLYEAYEIDSDTPIIIESPKGKMKINNIGVNRHREIIVDVTEEE